MCYKIIDLKSCGDSNGRLIPFENGVNTSFEIKRVFYIYNTRPNIIRGMHANRNSEFLMIAISGSCKIKIDDGFTTEEVILNDPTKALYLDKMIWKEMLDFSYNAILLVLTNTKYDNTEYIRDYQQYKEIIQQGKIQYLQAFQTGGGGLDITLVLPLAA